MNRDNDIRECTKCHIKYGKKSFYPKYKNDPDNVKSICKACSNRQNKEYRMLNSVRIKEYDRERNKTPEKYEYRKNSRKNNPEKFREYDRKYKEKNPDRVKQTNDRYNHSAKGILSRLRKNAQKRDIVCNLNQNDFQKWFLSQPKRCHYCGILEEDFDKWPILVSNQRLRMSIDRKDNSRGYSLDNIVLCCCKCNVIKNDLLTYNDMCEIGQKYVRPKWEIAIQETIKYSMIV